jgi:hypothetical protein
MKKILTITSALILCVILALVAGCSQPAVPPTTPVPTTVETTIAMTTAPTPVPTTLSLTPGPTQTLPEAWAVDVQVESNSQTIDPQVIATYRGGKGQNLIVGIDIRVTRSDGVVEDARMTQPLYVGKTVSLPGTRENKDRAEVWVLTPQGDRIKIYDAYVPFRQY